MTQAMEDGTRRVSRYLTLQFFVNAPDIKDQEGRVIQLSMREMTALDDEGRQQGWAALSSLSYEPESFFQLVLVARESEVS